MLNINTIVNELNHKIHDLQCRAPRFIPDLQVSIFMRDDFFRELCEEAAMMGMDATIGISEIKGSGKPSLHGAIIHRVYDDGAHTPLYKIVIGQ